MEKNLFCTSGPSGKLQLRFIRSGADSEALNFVALDRGYLRVFHQFHHSHCCAGRRPACRLCQQRFQSLVNLLGGQLRAIALLLLSDVHVSPALGARLSNLIFSELLSLSHSREIEF